MNQPNFTPSWFGQTQQRRDHLLDEAVFIALCAAIAWWVHKHWYQRAVRFLAGAGFGYVGGLIAFGAAFSGNQSGAAVWLTILLSLLPAIVIGEMLAKFAGKHAEEQHQAAMANERVIEHG